MKTPLVILIASIATLMAQQPKPGSDSAPAGDPFVKGQPAAENREPAAADDANQPGTLQAAYETFDISQADLLALLDMPNDDEARYKALLQWAAGGRAKLSEFTVLTLKNGNRSIAQSVDEVSFAREFDQAHAQEDGPFPTSFESQGAGETLELEVTVNEQGIVGVNLAPRVVALAKFTEQLAAPGRANSAISKPHFIRRMNVGTVTAVLSKPRMIGTLSAPGEDGGVSNTARIAFITVRPAVRGKAAIKLPELNLVRFDFTVFSVDRATARELWQSHGDSQRMYDTLRDYSSDKRARLELVNSVLSQLGDRVVNQAEAEVYYGTEFKGPKVPGESSGSDSQSSNTEPKTDEDPKKEDDKNAPPKPAPASTSKAISAPTSNALAKVQFAQNEWPKKAGIAPAFTLLEARIGGFTVELEPSVNEERDKVDVQFSLQLAKFGGYLTLPGVAAGYPQQPVTETRRMSASAQLIVGRQQLLGTFNPPGENGVNNRKDEGRVWLVFARATGVK